MMKILTEDKNVINPSRSESSDDVVINRISPRLASTFVDRLKKNRLLNCVENDNISDDISKDRVGTTSSPRELFSTFSTTILTTTTAQTESDKTTETQTSIFVGSGDTTVFSSEILQQLGKLDDISLIGSKIISTREGNTEPEMFRVPCYKHPS